MTSPVRAGPGRLLVGAHPMIDRILVPLDGSRLAEAALPQAAALADVFGAAIVLLRVVEPPSGDMQRATFTWRLLRAEAEAYLDEIRMRIGTGGRTIELRVAEGRVAEEILRSSRGEGVDLMVLSSHGQGSGSAFAFGETARQVMSAAPVSLLIVRPESDDVALVPYRRIAVALDGSQRAEWALCLAAAVAAAHGAELHAVHVVQIPEMARRVQPSDEESALRERVVQANRSAAEQYMASVRGRFGDCVASIKIHIVTAGSIPRKIRDVVEQLGVDLLVLSAHGYSGDERWLYGGTTDSLLAHSPVPLLVLQDMRSRREEAPLRRDRVGVATLTAG